MKLPFYDWYRNLVRNSKYRWLIIAGTFLYLFSPIDLLPDMIPLIGQIDDTVLLGLLVAEVSSMLMDRLKAQKDMTTATVNGKPAQDAVEVEATTVK
ncbi:YkvA family protein [Leptolyngbya sp. AN03gr2]|uniref:YkvA family protein n=1 Tax=unclassified Leptolyngbya TaxID=2650499 RepID=UPI003D31BCE0